ncbi:MAG: hypothetical protein KC550_01570, partial [Nanoarchaeota archaeon]|nr:hypothetical protein [Nanoarchaeota archaeon]
MNERYSTFGSSSFKGTIGNLNSPLCDLDCATDRVRQLLENYLKDITRGFDYFDINISSSGNHAYDLHLNLTLFSDE